MTLSYDVLWQTPTDTASNLFKIHGNVELEKEEQNEGRYILIVYLMQKDDLYMEKIPLLYKCIFSIDDKNEDFEAERCKNNCSKLVVFFDEDFNIPDEYIKSKHTLSLYAQIWTEPQHPKIVISPSYMAPKYYRTAGPLVCVDIPIKTRLINKQYSVIGHGAEKSIYASCTQNYFLDISTSTTDKAAVAPRKTK